MSPVGVRLTSCPFDDADGKEFRERLAAVYFTRDPIITMMRTACGVPEVGLSL